MVGLFTLSNAKDGEVAGCGLDIIEGCKVDVNSGRGDMCDKIGEEG